MGSTPLHALFASPVVLQNLPDALDFSWVRWVAVMATWLLLPLVAMLLIHGVRLVGGRPNTRYTPAALLALMAVLVVLSVGVMYYNGLLSWPGWLGASLLFFGPCALAGAGLATAFVFARRGRSRMVLLVFSGAAILLGLLVLSLGGFTGLAGITGNYYYGWGLCAVPPLIGGVLLARSIAARQTRRTWYIALWLIFAGTIGLGAYMNQMEGITYAFVAPGRMFGPYANARVTDALLASIAATFVYVAGSLALLLLPFRPDTLSGPGQPQAVY